MTARVGDRAERIGTETHRDLIIDVGAHRGEDAGFYLRKGFRVVAIEADPDLAATCRARLATYIASGRCTVIEGAVVDPAASAAGQRTVRFYKNDANPVWGTLNPQWADRNARLGAGSVPIDVPVVDFVDVLRTHGIPRYLKVDIEGADMDCVRALARFAAGPDYVSLEVDKTSLAAVTAQIETLRALGYSSFQAVEQSAVSEQRVPDPAREGDFIEHRFESGSSGLFGAELPGEWRSASAVRRQLGAIRLGYYLLGDDGVMHRWRFRGHGRLRRAVARWLERFTRGAVPGWHDLHARHERAAP